jgi:Tol biopolymer transport system component
MSIPNRRPPAPVRARTYLSIIGFTVFAGAAIPLTGQSTSYHSLAPAQQFAGTGRQVVSIAPDGSQFVYVANNSLYVKGIKDKEARLLEGTGSNVTNPVFSPDGQSIAFWSGQDQTLKRLPVTGGTSQTICPAANPHGMSWSADDTILFGQGANGIRRVRATGGTAETIIAVKSDELAHGPQLLPDGQSILFTLASTVGNAARGIPPELQTAVNNARNRGNDETAIQASLNAALIWDNARITVQSLKGGEPRTLLERGRDARYAASGHLVYAAGGALMAVPFDTTRLELSGTPTKLLDRLRTAGTATGSAQFSVANTGALVYLATDTSQPVQGRQFGFADMDGKVTMLRSTSGSIFGPRISPDGKHVTYRDNGAVWIADLMSEAPPRRLTTEPGEAPIWSPDGERIAFISIFNGMEALFWRRADGTGSAELLVERARAPESWAKDNRSFTFITLVGPSGDGGDYDIASYSIRDKQATPLIAIPKSAQSGSRLSPDGRWIAYESNESGRAEVFAEPLPGTGQRYQVSKTGGARPIWANDMSKIYFDNNSADMRMVSVDVRTQPAFTLGEPVTLPTKGFIQPTGTIRRQYDITPDGTQFLMMFPTQATLPRVEILSNWQALLKMR